MMPCACVLDPRGQEIFQFLVIIVLHCCSTYHVLRSTEHVENIIVDILDHLTFSDVVLHRKETGGNSFCHEFS